MENTMSPKQEEKKEPVSGNTGSSDEQEMEDVEEQDEDLVNEDDFDLEELAALNENLDNLNAALDTIEQRADQMKEKVMELLLSNREITKALREQNAAEAGGSQCNHLSGKPAEEA